MLIIYIMYFIVCFCCMNLKIYLVMQQDYRWHHENIIVARKYGIAWTLK